MRKIVLIALVNFAWCGALLGQSVDYNKIILPSSVKDASIEERLIQIAWANMPATTIAHRRVTMARNTMKKEQWAWLDHIHVSGNLNEFTINGRTSGSATFYPRYNFSIGFSLGTFAFHTLNVKNAREALKIEEENINDQKLNVRAEVLRRYSTYKSNKEVFEIQDRLLTSIEAIFKVQKEKFDRGEISPEQFSGSEERYTNQRVRTITANTNYQHAKFDLEQMLGLKLEDIL